MVQGGNYFNVGDALSSLDGAISGLDSRVTELESFPGNGNNGSGNTGSGGRSTGGSTSETAVAGTGGTDVGEGGVVTGGNSIALGAGPTTDNGNGNTVSVGSVGNEAQITNVADGVSPTESRNTRQPATGVAAERHRDGWGRG